MDSQKRASSFTELQSRLLQYLGIPLTALLSVIFGLFLVSFPIGMFVVFDTMIGGDITHGYPVTHLDIFENTDAYRYPAGVTIGDAFTVLWAAYVVVFVVSIMGPGRGFVKSLSNLMSHGRYEPHSSYMMGVTMWFSVLVLLSVVIVSVQGAFGIDIIPPPAENDLVQFFYVSLAPLIEEVGFRMILLGIPLFALYSGRASFGHFVKCLWQPSRLDIISYKKAIVLIIVTSVLFGAAHVISGEPWSGGKFAQAVAGGMVLGWAYIRYGFAASLLIHWGTNYFIFAYAIFVSQTNLISLDEAFLHPLLSSIEVILVASGMVSVAAMIIHRIRKRSEVQGSL